MSLWRIPFIFTWSSLVFFTSGSLTRSAPLSSDSTYLIESWQTEQGLPENSATAMVQTPDGYLWFGSFEGLVRFDGVRFTVFDSSNTPQLPNSGIVNLHLDGLNRLWVSTLNGLVVSKPNRWTDFQKKEEWTGDHVRTFSEHDGVICITSFNGKVFCAKGDEMRELPEPPGMRGRGYFGYVDKRSDIWVVQEGFFGRWNLREWEPSVLMTTVTNGFKAAATDRDGNLIVFAGGKLRRIDHEKILSEIKPEATSIFNIWRLDEDREGTVWINTSHNGLFGVSPDGKVSRYTILNGLSYDSIRFTFEDREGNLWVGSSGGGLSRLKRRTFTNYDLENGLPERAVKALLEEGGSKILVGTYGQGLARLEFNKISRVLKEDGTKFGPYVQCLLRDRKGDLWMGTFGEGVQIKHGNSCRVLSPDMTGGSSIAALFADSQGRIWIGGNETVSVYADGVFTRHDMGVPPQGTRCFAENAADHSIWAGTAEALRRNDGASWTEVKRDGNSIARTTFLHAEADGTMWVGAGGSGLLRWRSNSWVSVIGGEVLPTRNIVSMVEDNFGFWWLGSDRGIIRARKSELDAVADGKSKTFTYQLFDRSDGLGSIECASGFQSTVLKDSNGRLYFATIKGITTVDPATLRLNTNIVRIHFETISFIDQNGVSKSLSPGTAPLRVPPGSRQMEVYTAALCYSGPEKVQLEYRLKKGDRTVSHGRQRSRSIVFGWLPPGKYALSVVAANNDGFWGTQPSTLEFLVEPYFWQTIWFRLSAILSGLAAACVLARQVTRSKLRQHIGRLQQQRAIEHERARLGTVLEATSDFVAFSSPEGALLFINDAGRRMVGLEKGESIQTLWISDFYPASIRQRVMNEAVEIAKRDGLWSGETALRHRDRGEIPVSQVIVAHKAPNGRLDFLSTIARDITERKQAEDELRTANVRLHRLSAHLFDIQESERRFIAKELHDQVGQSLTAATLNFRTAATDSYGRSKEAFEDGIGILNEVLGQVRDLSLDLRPSMLDHVGLPAAVRWQVDRIAQRAGFRAAVTIPDDTRRYSPELEIACYRIVQEALTNAARHARARNVRVELRADGNLVFLQISDDGLGFEPEAVRKQSKSFGIFGMEERASLLGGEMTLESAPGEGTVISVRMPLRNS